MSHVINRRILLLAGLTSLSGSAGRALAAEEEPAVATTTVPLDAVDQHLRTEETNLGSMVADVMRAAMGADAAVLNAGAFQGDRLVPAGPLTRRMLDALLPWGNVVCKIEVTGGALLKALHHGTAGVEWLAGAFPQVSGIRYQVDLGRPPGSRAAEVRVAGALLDRRKLYTLALNDYMLKGGDDYDMFFSARVLTGVPEGRLLLDSLENWLKRKSPVAPRTDGRIRVLLPQER